MCVCVCSCVFHQNAEYISMYYKDKENDKSNTYSRTQHV